MGGDYIEGMQVCLPQVLSYFRTIEVLPLLFIRPMYISITFLDIIHLPVFILKHTILETEFSLHLQVKPVQMGPIVRPSPYLWTPEPTQDRVYKPSTAQTIYES